MTKMMEIIQKIKQKEIRPIVLAPMEGVTNMPFRILCKRFGADIVYTEFTSSEALTRDVVKSHDKLKFTYEERPLGIQVFGPNVEVIKRAAVEVVETYEPDILDINCGCPVAKVTADGAGSGFLRDMTKLEALAKKVVSSVAIPVSFKIRIGWDSQSIIVEDAVKILRDNGVQIVTIHARTRSQMYQGTADWTWLKKAKKAAEDLIIFGNGDVKCPEDAKKMFDETGVDGVMIGRAAIDNPWIFNEVKHYLKTNELLENASIFVRINTLIEHIDMMRILKGDLRTALEIRKHYSAYLRNVSGIKSIRNELMGYNSVDAIKSRLQLLMSELQSHVLI